MRHELVYLSVTNLNLEVIMKRESILARLSPVTPPHAACALTLLSALPGFAGTEQWQGVPGVSATINWTDANNWTSLQQTYYNQVQFTGTGANSNNDFTVNNIFDSATGVAQVPIWELDYTPLNGNYTTQINPGVSLTLGAGRGYMYVGADQLNTGTPAAANAVETITLTGPGGALNISGSLYVGQGSPQAGDTHNVTLDLSGLGNFIANPGNEILVASGGADRTDGSLYLAETNAISLADDFLVCNQNLSNSVPCAVYLGQVKSIHNGTGNLTIRGVVTTTEGACIKFNPAFVSGPTPPTATIGGTGSDGRIINFWIGNANGGPQVSGSAACDLTGGSVSVKARAMQIGQGGNAGASSQGVLTFDNGVVNANTAMVGNQEVSSGGAGIGTINLNSNSGLGTNATLLVNGTLTLAEVTGTLTSGTAGTVNVNGGALIAGNIVSGGGAAVINLTNGSATINTTAGTASAPLTGITSVNSSFTLAVSKPATNIFVSSLTTGGPTNLIDISGVLPGRCRAIPVTVTLIKYAGSIDGAGFNFGTLAPVPQLCAGYVSNDTANAAVDLVLTSGPLTYTWTGAANANWDYMTSIDWNSGVPVMFSDGAFVQFLDGPTETNINLTTTLSPGGTTVSNNTLTYTFGGSGN